MMGPMVRIARWRNASFFGRDTLERGRQLIGSGERKRIMTRMDALFRSETVARAMPAPPGCGS